MRYTNTSTTNKKFHNIYVSTCMCVSDTYCRNASKAGALVLTYRALAAHRNGNDNRKNINHNNKYKTQ